MLRGALYFCVLRFMPGWWTQFSPWDLILLFLVVYDGNLRFVRACSESPEDFVLAQSAVSTIKVL
jgi:hypothetical protein